LGSGVWGFALTHCSEVATCTLGGGGAVVTYTSPQLGVSLVSSKGFCDTAPILSACWLEEGCEEPSDSSFDEGARLTRDHWTGVEASRTTT